MTPNNSSVIYNKICLPRNFQYHKKIQQTTNNKQGTTNNKQQTTNNKQGTTNKEQQTRNNKQGTTNKQQPHLILFIFC